MYVNQKTKPPGMGIGTGIGMQALAGGACCSSCANNGALGATVAVPSLTLTASRTTAPASSPGAGSSSMLKKLLLVGAVVGGGVFLYRRLRAKRA